MSDPDFEQEFLEDITADDASWDALDEIVERNPAAEPSPPLRERAGESVFTDVTLSSPEPVTGVREFEVEACSAFAATVPAAPAPTHSESEFDALLDALIDGEDGPVANPTSPDLESFWGLIDEVRQRIGHDPVRRVMALREELAKLTPEALIAFEYAFGSAMDDAYCWRLWAGGFMIHGGMDANAFINFRGWLISLGRHDFERVVADPEQLVDVIAAESQTLLPAMVFLAEHVYEQATGQAMPYPKERKWPAVPNGSKIALESDAALEAALPKLWSAFGWMR